MKRTVVAASFWFFLVPIFLAPSLETVKLPRPDLNNRVSFAEVINQARTNSYGTGPLSAADLSCILWIAGGRRFNVDAVSSASRAYPSTFSWYPIHLYVLAGNVTGIKAGIYQYVPEEHGLKLLVTGDHRADVVKGAVYAGAVATNPATVVLAVDMSQNKARYNGHLWLPMELGFLAEAISLTAASKGHGISIVSEVDPEKAKVVCQIEEDPFLFLPIGN
jgi:SagB-type dehydrogenase family enzyme